MKLTIDDPKLTAYALSELSEIEAREVETEIKNSPEMQLAVKGIRATAALLEKEFSVEPALPLSEKQKEVVVAKIAPTNIIPFPRRKIFAAVGIGAIAASVAVVLTWQFGQGSKRVSVAPQTNSDFRYAQNAISQQKKAAEENEAAKAVTPPVTPDPSVKSGAEKLSLIQRDEALKSPPSIISPKPGANHESYGVEVAGKNSGKEAESLGQLAPTAETLGDSILLGAAKTTEEPVALAFSAANKSAVDSKHQATRGVATVNSLVTSTAGSRVANQPAQQFYDYEPNGREVRFRSDDLYAKKSAPSRSKKPAPRGVELGRGDFAIINGDADGDGLNRQRSEKDGRFLGNILQQGETARYPKYVENSFESVSQNPLSTFSIDVDTASYANVRRFLNENRLPPGDAVRIEELINYFSYNYPQPKGDEPFSANLEVASCPWNSQHRLVRIGLKGKEIAQGKRPPSNFVFLIDVSGSMSPSERLPLIKQALRMLVKRMTENDRIAIVVYASSSGVVLESTSCANKEKILEALDRLEAGGSTNGGEGVQRAYALAEENFIKGGVNRVILCTDGDFNVGITDQSELVNLIQRKAKSGVFLSALGVGTDNYKDALMQKLADKGNGNYHYIDTMEEAQKVLIQQMNGTLVTIAKDVKIQIEFNPAQVSSYRLIGYEKRILAAEDFNNDKKDAGEIGAGHTVTALYEIIPANGRENDPRVVVDDLKYQERTPKPKREISNDNPELLTLKLRYKKPDGNTSKLSETTVTDSGKNFSQASSDFKFASAVASFGMMLKGSEYKGAANYNSVIKLAQESKGDDKEGYRAEFINLVKKAKSLNSSER